MPDKVVKMEGMLFEYPTTYLNDYRKEEFRAPVATVYKTKPSCMMRRPPPLRDVHTMSDWKAQSIPFDLLHKPRDIVGTNPWKVQERYEKPKDIEREQAQKSRPRLVMTPAVSMDDIDDPLARELLCEDMYISDMAKGMKEAVAPYTNVQAPFAKHPAPSNPITLRKLQPYLVSPEWRMQTVRWDNQQLRAHCDATKDFWLKFQLPKCRACDETAVVKAHRKMLRQKK
ncbi:uncharacterized protein LOC135088369 [Ostrinia nubilalis]|uniref:uncharacterized protein LOC135088369 n=1 Tax=Ostrinia nubilalis TaxID=29057 RepID=UPI0030822FF3